MSKIPQGYRRRASGATMTAPDRVECPLCHRRVYALFGLERNYPNDPDIFACFSCVDEYYDEICPESKAVIGNILLNIGIKRDAQNER